MIRYTLMLSAALAIAGCGFQLRTDAIEVTLPRLAIVAEGASIASPLRDAFEKADVRVVPATSTEPWVITVRDQRSRAIPVAMTEDVRISELDLELSIELDVSHHGDEVFSERVLIERPVRIDRDNLVSSRQERRVVLAEMREHLVNDIVRIVDAVVRSVGESGAEPER